MVSSEELLDILGNETRSMILELLAERSRYTTEIASILEIGQKAINEHLRIMSEFGVIEPYVQKPSFIKLAHQKCLGTLWMMMALSALQLL